MSSFGLRPAIIKQLFLAQALNLKYSPFGYFQFGVYCTDFVNTLILI